MPPPKILAFLALHRALLGLAAAAWRDSSLRTAAVALALGAAALLLPALPPGDLAALADVGAVHMRDGRDMPARAPAGVTLLVLPERAETRVPRVQEGPGRGRRLGPALRGPRDVARLEGFVTHSGRRVRNSLLALAPDGTILGMRAKRVLFPLVERPWFGLEAGPWAGRLVPGKASPLLEVDGRRVAGLLCFEALDGGLLREAREGGAAFLALAANDRVLAGSPIADRQILAVAVFAAVQSGLPVVRASMFGPAAFLAADGTILTWTPSGTAGVLTTGGDVPLPRE